MRNYKLLQNVQLYLEKFQKYEKNEVQLPTITKDVLK